MNCRSAVFCWLGLLALLALSLLAGALDNTALRYSVHFICAGAMAALIMLVFMHLYTADRLLRLVAVSGLLWIALLILLTLADMLTR
ncbi:cytochrome C oxidase subunit IV family protein [Microbulbifer halophilus]|uniref:Cytochrome C oxidase subunit IV family protein n=1 Tax=Microbulbifer halophilus TaxID=453963 RepID=A0ABW5EE79_9GAMM|nr:cytochrome C oxidase subunit IV family protein [Microbulbifer halophilus]MCW8127719.1 hypothetical protein [Microbulbifer halophilus]